MKSKEVGDLEKIKEIGRKRGVNVQEGFEKKYIHIHIYIYI
jgi:uncharacterized alkaline shock family protein YloU